MVILGCLLINKGCLLFVTSQLHPYVTFLAEREHVAVVNDTQPTSCGAPYCLVSNTDCQVLCS